MFVSYIYEKVFYISGNFSLFFMWADTDHLLPNYTAFIAIFVCFTHIAVETACIIRKKTSVYEDYIHKVLVIANDKLPSEFHKYYVNLNSVTS